MKGKWRLYVDQYGQLVGAHSVRELCQKLGRAHGSARRIYRDKKNGPPVHVGYIVAGRWFDCYIPYDQPC